VHNNHLLRMHRTGISHRLMNSFVFASVTWLYVTRNGSLHLNAFWLRAHLTPAGWCADWLKCLIVSQRKYDAIDKCSPDASHCICYLTNVNF